MKSRVVITTLALLIALTLGVGFGINGKKLELNSSTVSALEKTSTLPDLSTLNRVLLKVSQSYFDPTRIDPNKMLSYALYSLEYRIPEVIVHFDRDIDLNPTQVEVAVQSHKKTFNIGSVNSTWEASYKLKMILSYVAQYVDVKPDEQRDIEYAAINGMLSTLDPHTVFLPPKNFEEIRTQTGGKFGGIGIEISPRDGRLVVMTVLPNMPAEKAGIKPRDVVVQINDQSTLNITLDDAVDLLRGEPDTTVDIYVERPGVKDPIKFTVPRAIIKLKSVVSKALPDRVAYLRISNFQANTYTDFLEQYEQLTKDMHGIDGMIIDLRDNPGGLLDQSVKIANLFLKSGAVVSTVGAGNKVLQTESATERPTLPSFPLVLLTNAGTASASEILAGALKNHDRAVTIGDTTFGKGSVQILHEFANHSAVKLTIAQYLTPGNLSIQGYGIPPDIYTHGVEADGDYLDLFPPKQVLREGKLSSHLTNRNATNAYKKPYDLEYLDQPIPKDSTDPLDDFNIRLAYRLIVRTGRRTILKRPFDKDQLDVLHEVGDEQQQKITEELRSRGIGWASGKAPSVADAKQGDQSPELSGTAAFVVGVPPTTNAAATGTTTSDLGKADTKPSGKSAVDDKKADKKLVKKVETSPVAAPPVIVAGEPLHLALTVTNQTDHPLSRVVARSESDDPLLDDLEFIFGDMAPGQTLTWSAEVPTEASTQGRTSEVSFKAFSDGAVLPAKIPPAIMRLEAVPQPAYALTTSLEDTSGDGFLSPGEAATFVVRLTNTGRGDSKSTRILLRSGVGSDLFLLSGRTAAFDLKPGETKTFSFRFRLNLDALSILKEEGKGDERDKLGHLRIEVSDRNTNRFFNQIVQLPVRVEQKRLSPKDAFVVSTKPAGLYPAASLGGPAKVVYGTTPFDPMTTLPQGAILKEVGHIDGFTKVLVTPSAVAEATTDESEKVDVKQQVPSEKDDHKDVKMVDKEDEVNGTRTGIHSTNEPLTGYVQDIDLKDVKAPEDASSIYHFEGNTYTTPFIVMRADDLHPNKDKVHITVEVDSDRPLRDYVLLTQYRRGESNRYDKIAYGTLQNEKAVLQFDVPLRRGLNVVEFRLRRKDDVSSSESLIIVRGQ